MRVGLLVDIYDPSDPEHITPAEQALFVESLTEAGYDVTVIAGIDALAAQAADESARIELVFNMMLGSGGAERKMLAPTVLEMLGLPYTGSAIEAQGISRHKHLAKVSVRHAGVEAPRDILFPDTGDDELLTLRFPCIIKPVSASASVGITRAQSLASSRDEARAQARRLLQEHDAVLIEEFIPGLELEVPIIADPAPRALGVVALTTNGRLVDADEFLDAECIARQAYGFSLDLPRGDRERIGRAAEAAFTALGLRDYARIDFRLDATGVPWFIEANTHPDLTRHSSFYHLAKTAGQTHAQMLDAIVQAAVARNAAGTER
jgi:D-alanine-D-alanine ligase